MTECEIGPFINCPSINPKDILILKYIFRKIQIKVDNWLRFR